MKEFEKFKCWFRDSAVYRHLLSAIAHPKNFMFLKRYPFWKVRNVINGKFVGYDASWYESIPEGWRKAFGRQLTEDIVRALSQDGLPRRKWAEAVYWSDIKEKYGSLRLYASTTDAVYQVLSKYECLSIGYCINCGKPARYVTSGWIEYLCEDCAADRGPDGREALSDDDVPTYYVCRDGADVEQTPLERFGIDLRKIWGLDDRKKG